MVVLRATHKVLQLLPESADAAPASTTALGDWYVNRIVVDRQPLLLLVSANSLLPAITTARDVKSLPKRLASVVGARLSRLGIDQKHGSCHTALVGGYGIEGHVPAREIKRLLAEKPAAIGLAVPGMPVGSPGMDGAVYGGRKDAVDVLLLAKGGSTEVYQRYEGVTKASGQEVGTVHKH